MKSRMMVLAVLSIFSVETFACTEDGKEGIAPENKMYIPANKSMSGITEKRFNKVIDRVAKVYEPIISALGATLKVSRNWSDGTVNAYASRSGSVWNVSMFGGLARHETVTADGFALVLCHEIGHHIGGAPKYSTGNAWASNEGQSDYWGTLKCFRRVFEQDDNESITEGMKIPDSVKAACKTARGEENNDYFLCLRSAMAGKSLANLLATLGGAAEPQFETPDSKVVTATNSNHPKAQCRLDTYYNGSLCQVEFRDDVDQADEVLGTCHQRNETSGVRPLCWFKPTL